MDGLRWGLHHNTLLLLWLHDCWRIFMTVVQFVRLPHGFKHLVSCVALSLLHVAAAAAHCLLHGCIKEWSTLGPCIILLDLLLKSI